MVGDPGRPLRGAQPPRRRRRSPPTWPPSRTQISRILGPEGRWTLVDNLSWTAGPAPARLPPRRRQARHREPDGGPGEREGPHGERARHLLHGVQLHAPAGQRLRPPAPARGLRAPDRRLRPVGQHPLRASTSSAVSRGAAVHALCWPLLTAADGTEARQDHRRPGLARPRPHLARTRSSSTGSTPTTPRCARMLAQFTLLPDGRDRRARSRSTPPTPRRRVAQRALAREVTELVHGAEAAPGRRGGQRRSSSAPIPGRRRRRRWPPWPREVPVHRARAPGRTSPTGSTSAPCCSAAGLASSQGDARRQLEQGGVSVNGEKAAPDRRLGAADAAPRPLGAAAQGEEGLGGARCYAQRS